MREGDIIRTGVSWCEMRITSELLDLVSRAQENEGVLKESLCDSEAIARALITTGVDAAEALAADASLPTEELLDICFSLKGRPLDQAPARRDMRERIRIWRRLNRREASVPGGIDDLFSLWEEAVFGEYPLYRESASAGFRTGIPFVEYIGAPKATAVPPRKKTVAPADLVKETNALLAFMQRADIEVELHVAAVVFAFLYIHPFRDGNGHTHRMLACSMLSQRYSAVTLVAFVRARQAARQEESLLIQGIVEDNGDFGPYAQFMLEKLCTAQESLMQRLRQHDLSVCATCATAPRAPR